MQYDQITMTFVPLLMMITMSSWVTNAIIINRLHSLSPW